MNCFRFLTFAKINLTLNISKKQSDGMHPIVSVFQSISLADTLTITPKKQRGLTFHSNAPFLEEDPNNLFFRLFHHFEPCLTEGLDIYLEKQIPIGGGLGGGSSNAATFLYFLNDWAPLNLTQEELIRIGHQFSSDIPFFFLGSTAMVTGTGDKIEPTTFPDLPPYFLLIVPDMHISTPKLYADYDAYYPTPPEQSTALGKNDFWEILRKQYPIFEELAKFTENELNTSLCLSGSGSTTFLPANSESLAKEWENKILTAFSVRTWIVQPNQKGFCKISD